MKSIKIALWAVIVTLALPAYCRDFFSTEIADTLFDIGLRLGVNSSNRTFPEHAFNQWNVNSWGTGVDLGCIVDLNIRDYFTIQPGLFIESRSMNYSYSTFYYDKDKTEQDFTQLGHDRSYNITATLMFSPRFNISDDLRWIVEIGPYGQYKFQDSSYDKVMVIDPQPNPNSPIVVRKAVPRHLDFGLKAGTGFSFKHKYSLFIHYMAGFRDAWSIPLAGGRNKAWLFTVGYEIL